MKRFMAIYIGTEAAVERAKWNQLDEEKRKAREAAGMKAWMDWGTEHVAFIVENGGPLGKTKRAARRGSATSRTSWLATRWSRPSRTRPPPRCSRITRTSAIFPGDSVEIMRSSPIPAR